MGAEAQVVGHRQLAVGRGVLGDETHPGQLRRTVRRVSAQNADRPRRRDSSPTARFKSVVFPAPFGPTSPTTCPEGTSRLQSVRAQRRRP